MADNPMDKAEKLVILKHLLRREPLLRGCFERLRHTSLFSAYADCQLIFELIFAYYEDYRKMLPCDVLLNNLLPAMAEKGMDIDHQERMKSFLLNCYRETEWADAYIQDLVLNYLRQQTLSSLQQRLPFLQSAGNVDDSLRQALNEYTDNPFQKLTPSNPFENIADSMRLAQRYPLGLQFMDYILDGGVCPGEVIGFIGPSGGGKTTVGMQCAYAQVQNKKHVIYLSTEQRQQGDLSIRTFCLAAKVERKIFKQGYDTISQEVKDALARVRQEWLTYFHFIDCTNPRTKNIDELFQPVEELMSSGVQPFLLIIDWWGRLRNRMIVNNQVGSEQMNRIHTQEWLYQIKAKSENLRLVTLVLHQMSGEAAKKSAAHKPSSHDAQEDRNFNNMMDFCFVLGKLDSGNEAILIADKARATARRELRVKLDGERCLFRAAQGPDTSGIFVTNTTQRVVQ